MKNKILWTITIINLLSFIGMAAAVDSDSWIPLFVMCVNLLWLMPFVLINYDYFGVM